jgi:hypothetical protein
MRLPCIAIFLHLIVTDNLKKRKRISAEIIRPSEFAQNKSNVRSVHDVSVGRDLPLDQTIPFIPVAFASSAAMLSNWNHSAIH